jgi:hypothetical protein
LNDRIESGTFGNFTHLGSSDGTDLKANVEILLAKLKKKQKSRVWPWKYDVIKFHHAYVIFYHVKPIICPLLTFIRYCRLIATESRRVCQ